MATTTDDAFHEIQLNGKQLVFLFMAAVVVSVVIFLCGVLVGRGVRGEAGSLEAAVAPAAADVPVDTAVAASPSSSTTASNEELTYPSRLASPEPPPETIRRGEATKPAVRAPAPTQSSAAPAPPPPTAAGSPLPPAPAAAVATAREPSGVGFAIQVAALRQRAEADTVARGLSGKGYPAYVMNPEPGAPPVFRVRIGKYKERRDAESVAARLQKEEQFKPWIVR